MLLTLLVTPVLNIKELNYGINIKILVFKCTNGGLKIKNYTQYNILP